MTDPNANAPTPPAAQPATTAGDARPQYEFDAAQNEVINNFVVAILWVRLPLMVIGVLQGAIAIGLCFRLDRDGAHVVGIMGHALAAVVCFLLAGWLRRAAAAFARVTTTTGRDITHLLTGLRNLGSWFDVLGFFMKLYLGLLAVLITLLAVGLLTGTFKEPPPAPPTDDTGRVEMRGARPDAV